MPRECISSLRVASSGLMLSKREQVVLKGAKTFRVHVLKKTGSKLGPNDATLLPVTGSSRAPRNAPSP